MDTLELLLGSPTPPPFIFVHHPHHPTTSLRWPEQIKRYRIDAIECHTPKLLWSAVISRLEGSDAGLVDSMDTFLRRLRALKRPHAKGKGKERAVPNGHAHEDEGGLCIVITKAERLPRVLGQTWTAMTRLAELVRRRISPCGSRVADTTKAGLPISVVLASSVPWDEMRPPRGDALEPIHLYLPQASRDGMFSTPAPRQC